MNSNNQKIKLIKTRGRIKKLLNKGLSIEEISKKIGIRIGNQFDRGSIKWFKKCIISKISMKKRHKEYPEIFTRKRLNLDESRIKELYLTKELPPYKIAKIIKCDTMTIINRLRGMNVKIRSYKESRKLKTYARLKKIRNYGFTPEKAYILGVLCGDGWIRKEERMFRIGLASIDKDFVKEFQKNIKEAYGVYCPIRKIKPKNIKWNDQYCLHFNSKLACEDILAYGNFNTSEWRVPKRIINSDNVKIIGNFLRGLYDSEGCANYKYYELKATTSNKKGLFDILKLLEKLKIRYRTKLKRHKNKKYKLGYEVIISGSDSYKRFKKYIGFSIKRKQHNLLKMQNIRKQKRYTKENFENALKLKKQGLGIMDISRKTGVIRTTISKWFNNEERYFKLLK